MFPANEQAYTERRQTDGWQVDKWKKREIEWKAGWLICRKDKHYMGSKNNLTWVDSGYNKGGSS